jgi:glycosyltransferase involved in cell wall biosynthesis
MTSVYALGENDRNGSFLVESNRHLRDRGVDVRVFAPSYEGRKNHTVAGVPVYRFRYFPKRWENLTHMRGAPNRIRNPFYLFVAFFYILSGLVQSVWFCLKNDFDVLHVHWPFPHGIWGYFASRMTGRPMVLTFHGAEILLSKKFFFVKYFLRHALRNAEAVVCNSSYTAGEVAKLTDKPVHVVPFGTTVETRPVKKDPNKPVKKILFVGRLIARKGLDHLLRAMPLIAARVPVHLDVVSDGDKGPEWKALAQELGLGGLVTFHGIVDNKALEQHYAEADVFVLPAIVDERGDTEGLGVVLVEALSFRTPVVASNVGGIPDVIKDGVTGLLVPQKDSQALADAVVRVLQDPALAEAVAEGGLRHARDYFDWGRITAQLMDIYAAVARPRRRPGRGRDREVLLQMTQG